MPNKRNVKTPAAALSRTNSPVAVDGLENVAAGLGTSRDKSTYSRYTAPRNLNQMELENMYRTSWLAKRVVNAVADDMTREWRTVIFDSKDENSQFAVETLEKGLQVRARVNEALRWGRLYGGAVIVIGIEGQALDQPLDISTVQKDSLKWLQVVDRWRLTNDGNRTMDLSSPNFGLPEKYMLAESSVQVHHSRVLRFGGQKLPHFSFLANMLWDDSELQHVLDSITNADAASGGIATMLFESNVDVIKSEGLADAVATKGGEEKVLRRFQIAATMKSYNRVLLLDGSEDYEKKHNQFSNLDKVWTQFMVDVCGAADIPMTRLFGQSAAGLTATGDNDIRNYYDMVAAKQESELKPRLEYLDEILVRSALGHMPEDYRFEFDSLWQLSDTDNANNERTRAERDALYINAGVITEGVVARELKERGVYSSLTDEDVELADELSKAAPEFDDENGQSPPDPSGEDNPGGNLVSEDT